MEKVFKGYNGDLILTENGVVIRKGLKGFFAAGGKLRGEKTIPYSSITAVQFKKSRLTSGYIQLSIKGGNEGTGGIFDALKDENSVTFNRHKKNKEFLLAKELIEEKIFNN